MARLRAGLRALRNPILRARGRVHFDLPLAAVLAQLMFAPLGCTTPRFVNDEADRDAQDDDNGGPDDAHGEPEDAGADHESDAGPPADGDAGADLSTSMLDGAVPANDAAPQADATSGDPDAGQRLEAGAGSTLPSWALPLIGTYAKRSVTFSYDDASIAIFGAINTRNVEYSILTISQRGNELELSLEMCAFRVVGSDSSEFYFKNPAGMPKLTGRIVLGAPNSFSSERMVQSLGFDPARGTSCGASGRRTKYPDQTWSSAMCECRASPLPDSLNDCRVIDGDSDARPGITGRGGFTSASPTDVVLAFQYALTFSDGQVRPDQAHELHELRTQSQECLNDSLTSGDGCNFGNNTLCPDGTTKLLHREGVTCANFPEDAFEPLPGLPSPVKDCRR